MTRWEFRIVPCLAGGNASATCPKMLVMRFARAHTKAELTGQLPRGLHRLRASTKYRQKNKKLEQISLIS